MSEKTNNELFQNILLEYMRNRNDRELEIRFGTNTSQNPITRESFENVIKKFKSYGFNTTPVNAFVGLCKKTNLIFKYATALNATQTLK